MWEGVAAVAWQSIATSASDKWQPASYSTIEGW